MSKEYLEKKRQEILHDNTTEKWYFDACVLEEEKIFNYIYHKGEICCIASHLSIGEAVSNFIIKLDKKLSDDEKSERIKAYISFINKLHKEFKLEIVGHDEISKNLDQLRENTGKKGYPRLSTSDSIHLATAGVYKCSKIYSTDGDLTKMSKPKIKEIGKSFGIEELVVITV